MVQGSEAWLEWRRLGIGASEIAAIIGKCKYSTPYRVWSEKVGLSTGFAGNFATQRGSEMEAKARACYELINLEDMPAALAVHPKFEICRVSLDGLSEDRKTVLEIKCPGRESHDEALAGRVPEHYVPQVQYQLAVTGADELQYFSYTEESHAIVNVKPDVAYQGMLIAAALEFWEKYVLTKTPPPLTEDDVKIVDPVGEIGQFVNILINGKDTLPKVRIDELKEIIVSLGGHSKVRCGRALVSKSRTASGKDSYRLTVAKEIA